MSEKFRPRVRLMEMARRNRTTRAMLMSRENPQKRLRRLSGLTLIEGEEGNGKLNFSQAGQMVLWEASELTGK